MGLATSHVFQMMAQNCQEIGSCQLIFKHKIRAAYLDYSYLPSTYWNVIKKTKISQPKNLTLRGNLKTPLELHTCNVTKFL